MMLKEQNKFHSSFIVLYWTDWPELIQKSGLWRWGFVSYRVLLVFSKAKAKRISSPDSILNLNFESLSQSQCFCLLLWLELKKTCFLPLEFDSNRNEKEMEWDWVEVSYCASSKLPKYFNFIHFALLVCNSIIILRVKTECLYATWFCLHWVT